MGSLDGVVHTRAVWIGKHEVVEVSFRPDVASYTDLLTAAIEKGCAKRVWSTSDAQHAVATERVGDLAEKHDGDVRVAQTSDQLYYLEHSTYRLVPLTPLQARRVNGALYLKSDPKAWLSPRQVTLFASIEARLSSDEDALNGLVRPAAIDELAVYESTVRAKLK